MAIVKPARTVRYDFAQSKYEEVPDIPVRMIVAGPSGGGMTVLLQSMILSPYRTKSGKSPFSRIFIWRPSVDVDPAWQPVKEFIREQLGVGDKEKFCFDSYRPEELDAVINTQKKIFAAQKQRGDKRLFSSC